MEALIYSTLAGSATGLGALVLMLFGSPGKKVLSVFLGFAGGIMVGISLFELLPESIEFGTLPAAIIGFLLGAAMMYAFDLFIPHSHPSTDESLVVENPEKLKMSAASPMRRTGYLVFFGIALHNIPEGLAIGAGLEAHPDVGLAIAIAIGLHNLPEGLAIAGPLKAGGLTIMRVFLLTLLAGLMTPIGTGIGLLVLNVSPVLIGGSLAFAAGAMVYIVNDELIPQSNMMNSHLGNGGLIAGLVVALILFF